MNFEDLVTFLRFHNTEVKENLLVFDGDLVIKLASAFKLSHQVHELEEEYMAQNADKGDKLTPSRLKLIPVDPNNDDTDDSGSFISKDESEDNKKDQKKANSVKRSKDDKKNSTPTPTKKK